MSSSYKSIIGNILQLTPTKGDSADSTIRTWNGTKVELYDDQGTLLHSEFVNGETTFRVYLHALETYYLKIIYAWGCTPYRVKYNIPAVCPDEIYLTGTLSDPLYKAGVKIISGATIPGGSNVTFRAQQFELMKNFTVQQNAVFKTQQGGCN